jgi:hypothetical protein
MTKLTVAFHNFADAPKYTECCITTLHGQFMSPATMQIMRTLTAFERNYIPTNLQSFTGYI